MTNKKENPKCKCGCGRALSNTEVREGAKFKNRKHFQNWRSKTSKNKKKNNLKQNMKKVASGKGILSLLDVCYKKGYNKDNTVLYIKNKNTLASSWELYKFKNKKT